MLGLHVPMIHDITHSGRAPQPLGFVLVLVFGAMSIVGLWALLRSPALWTKPSKHEPPM
jgi:hypothetical protein